MRIRSRRTIGAMVVLVALVLLAAALMVYWRAIHEWWMYRTMTHDG